MKKRGKYKEFGVLDLQVHCIRKQVEMNGGGKCVFMIAETENFGTCKLTILLGQDFKNVVVSPKNHKKAILRLHYSE